MPAIEANIVKNILVGLRKIPNSRWLKTWGHTGNPGEPDISGCVEGVRVEIEVKAPGNKSTRIQAAKQDLWRQAGAVVLVDVTSWAEVKEQLAAALSERGVKRDNLAG